MNGDDQVAADLASPTLLCGADLSQLSQAVSFTEVESFPALCSQTAPNSFTVFCGSKTFIHFMLFSGYFIFSLLVFYMFLEPNRRLVLKMVFDVRNGFFGPS